MRNDTVRKTLTLARDIWAAHPSGSELLLAATMTVALIGMALCVAVPAEIEAVSVGNPLDAKGFCLFLLIGSIVFGALVGTVDTTGTRCIAETLPRSPLAISIKSLLGRLVQTMISWWTHAFVIVLRAGTCVARSPVGLHRLPLPTADLWPAGDSPRLIYES